MEALDMKLTREEAGSLVEALEVGIPEVLQAAEYAQDSDHKSDLFSKANLAEQIQNRLKLALADKSSIDLWLEYKSSLEAEKGMYFI